MNVARPAVLVGISLILAGCGSIAMPSPTTGGPTAPPRASAASRIPASLVPAPTDASAPTPTPQSAWAIDDAARASADPGLITSLAALPAPPGAARYAVTSVRQRGDWALVSIADADPRMASDSGFAFALREGGAWTVVFGTDTQAFCAALAEAPAGAMTRDELDYFTGCR